jgi:hypothetical protein
LGGVPAPAGGPICSPAGAGTWVGGWPGAGGKAPGSQQPELEQHGPGPCPANTDGIEGPHGMPQLPSGSGQQPMQLMLPKQTGLKAL